MARTAGRAGGGPDGGGPGAMSGERSKNFEPSAMTDELPGWIRLDALYRTLNNAYHPQNPIPDHPADFVERWASESEDDWASAPGFTREEAAALLSVLPSWNLDRPEWQSPLKTHLASAKSKLDRIAARPSGEKEQE